MTVEETGWQWWRFVLTVAVTLVFGLHSFTLYSQLMSRPTASFFTLVDNVPPRMPAVTVCPSLPFSVEALIQFGINTSCDTFYHCSTAIVKDLDGLPDNIGLQELWNASFRPLPSYVQWSSIHGTEITYNEDPNSWLHWKPSITSLGPCWTLIPPTQEPGDLIEPLKINIKSQIPCSVIKAGIFYIFDAFSSFPVCEELDGTCRNPCNEEKLAYSLHEHYNKLVILLHDSKDAPNVVDALNTITIYDSVGKEESVNTWVSVRETHLLESDECVSDPDYSFSRCLSLCQEKYVAKEFGCLSSLNFHDIRNKTCILQYMEFRVKFLKSLSRTEDDENKRRCKQSCKTPCKNTRYTFDSSSLQNNFYMDDQGDETRVYKFTLQMSAPYTESIIEEVIYTTSKFLTDLGGSLGLCFGFGLLTLHEFVYILLMKAFTFGRKVQRGQTNLDSEVMIHDKYPKERTSYFRKYWIMCGTTVCLLAFVSHSLQLTVAYWQYPKVSVPSLGYTLPPFPGVTLCPDVPFDLTALNGLGLRNDSELRENCQKEEQCDRDMAITYLLNALPGIWDSGVSLDAVWNYTRPIDDIVTEYEYDNTKYKGNVTEILTTMGKCFMFSPGEYDTDTLLFDIFLSIKSSYIFQELPFTQDIYGEKHSYNVMILLHPLHVTPIFLGMSAITHEKNEIKKLSLEVGIIAVKRVSTPKQNCHEKPYSRKSCIDSCFLKEAAEEIGCRLPYLKEYELPLCNTSSQYKHSLKGNAEPKAETRKKCEEVCGIECHTVYYNLIPKALDSGNGVYEKPDISIQKPAFSTLEIREELRTSFLSYISEMGGIMGLYLGMSLVDLITFCLWPIAYIMKRRGTLQSIIQSRPFNLLKVAWFFIMSFLLVIFSLMRLQDFVLNPKTYTKYSGQVNKWKHFPDVSICRWPPFNLTSLVSLGMSFDVNDYCEFHNATSRYYCFGALDEIMNKLPGLEDKSMSLIWEQAALNLSDILNAYSFNGKTYVVGSSDAVHWRARTTSLNRCFTFIAPEDETVASDLDLYLSKAGIKYERFYDRPTVHQVLHNIVAQEVKIYRAHNLVRIHPRGEVPMLNDDAISYPLYLNNIRNHLVLTASLTEDSRLSGRNQHCEEDENYSRFNCIQKCLMNEIVNQEKCKLPFATSFAVNECNITSYEKYPKYLDKFTTKLEHFKEKNSMCASSCPPSCRAFIYTMREETISFYESPNYPNKHVKVTVSLGKSSHDYYEEVPALSWASFVAEIGGVAGILTGVSLLSLTDYLLTCFTHMWSRIRYILEKHDKI